MYSLFCLEDFSWGSSVIVLPPKPQFEIPNRPVWKILYAIITHVHTFFFLFSVFVLGIFLCVLQFLICPQNHYLKFWGDLGACNLSKDVFLAPWNCMDYGLCMEAFYLACCLVVTAGKVCHIKRWQLGAEFFMLHTHNCLIANSFI